MLNILLGDECVSDAFCADIHRETEGNPFFVEEVVKTLVDDEDAPLLSALKAKRRALAEAALDLGFYLSIPGIITYDKPGALVEVVRALPLDSLMIETDAPYLAPVPHRGTTNQPAYLGHTAQFVADLRDTPVRDLSPLKGMPLEYLNLNSCPVADVSALAGAIDRVVHLPRLVPGAEAGSPRKSCPSLSISSSMKTGLFTPTFFMPWMIRPGRAPMYVRRCPRISDSSRIPPRLIRVNSRPSARATD